MKAKKNISNSNVIGIIIYRLRTKNSQAIIKINDGVITQKQYDELIDQNIASSPLGQMGDLKGNKDGFLYLMVEQNVINQLIVQELLNQEAESRDIKVTNKRC